MLLERSMLESHLEWLIKKYTVVLGFYFKAGMPVVIFTDSLDLELELMLRCKI